MPKYDIEAHIEIQIDGDEEEALRLTDQMLQSFHDQGVVTRDDPEWHYVLFEDCVRNLTAEANALASKATCRFCGRDIVDNPEDGWVDPEATGDDVMWRQSCDAAKALPFYHEPRPIVPSLEERLVAPMGPPAR